MKSNKKKKKNIGRGLSKTYDTEVIISTENVKRTKWQHKNNIKQFIVNLIQLKMVYTS